MWMLSRSKAHIFFAWGKWETAKLNGDNFFFGPLCLRLKSIKVTMTKTSVRQLTGGLSKKKKHHSPSSFSSSSSSSTSSSLEVFSALGTQFFPPLYFDTLSTHTHARTHTHTHRWIKWEKAVVVVGKGGGRGKEERKEGIWATLLNIAKSSERRFRCLPTPI